MQLCECKIELSNQQVYLYQTVEQSLHFIENQAPQQIKSINISATDGQQVHYYQCHSREDSLENLMNL